MTWPRISHRAMRPGTSACAPCPMVICSSKYAKAKPVWRPGKLHSLKLMASACKTGVFYSIYSSATIKPGACWTASTTATPVNGPAGVFWGDMRHTAYFGIIPPNGPMCTGNYSANNTTSITAGSYHGSGANVAFCDGSLRFVDESIDAGDQANGSPDSSGVTYKGASVWKVWGAIHSMNGGETNALRE